jgi:hypothetical protein
MLQNLKFWLKTRAFWQKVGNFQGSLVKNLQISKVFTPPQPEIAQLQGFYCVFK